MRNYWPCGSGLLKLNNARDLDYITFEPKELIKSNIYTENQKCYVDIHRHEKEYLQKYINFEYTFDRGYTYRWLYQLDHKIIGEDFPLYYDIFEHRDDNIRFLKFTIGDPFYCMQKDYRLYGGNCHKWVYHIAYLTFMLLNNSRDLTNEQRAIVQKIHDREMPQDYIDTLTELINSLK